ncbi:MAG: B12-binding domain-containing radical SAM protein [Candidatus Omnitrophica bacterium]|nr:B12-binding domain-containing radical SAM protein [Candidatus Omnitrophota bacterium]MBU1925178.1 B12-binding domain-containing radical SAM protein [Candidatus Omnitrophota bacterium]
MEKTVNLQNRRFRLRIVVPVYPAFNVYSYYAYKTTALGPVCVATSARQLDSWDVEVIDENNMRLYGPQSDERGADHEELQKARPADVVGFYGGLTSTIPRLYKIARIYKKKGLITIAGGQHFVEETALEALASGIDYLVIGEGEQTIKELLCAIEQGGGFDKIRGIIYKREGRIVRTPAREQITDFSSLPLPDFSLVRHAKIDVYPIERIRGCGMDCEFCTVKGKPRPAPVERCIEQIKSLVETRNARSFFMVDDLFGQQRDETIRLCNILRDYQMKIGRRLELGVQIRLDKAKDTELLTAMRQASITSVAIGFESPIEEELQAMSKRVRPQDMIQMSHMFHRFGFLVHGMFIFHYPLKEKLEVPLSIKDKVKRFKRFIKKAKVDTIQVLLPVPLPGTQLRQRLREENRIYPLEDLGWEYYDGNFPLFEPEAPYRPEDMQEAIKKIMSKFYQLKYMFLIFIKIFTLTSVLFFLHNIKSGWRQWYRSWRNYIYRFIGWITIKGWNKAFKKNRFLDKLEKAKTHLKADIGHNT